MLAAHMDQIGLMVTHVDEKGFCASRPSASLPAGELGRPGALRRRHGRRDRAGWPHEPSQELPELRDTYVDVGATSKAEVKQKVGDGRRLLARLRRQGNAWFSPNLDDRAGCIVLVQLLRELKDAAIAHDLYAVFTTQEEVGLARRADLGLCHRAGAGHRAGCDADRRCAVRDAGDGGVHGHGRRHQGEGLRHDQPSRAQAGADRRGRGNAASRTSSRC